MQIYVCECVGDVSVLYVPKRQINLYAEHSCVVYMLFVIDIEIRA